MLFFFHFETLEKLFKNQFALQYQNFVALKYMSQEKQANPEQKILQSRQQLRSGYQIRRQQAETRISGLKRNGSAEGQTEPLLQKQSQFRASLWQLDENISYMRFLVQNQQLFGGLSRQHRLIKINVMMSAHVGTRSPDQCRSHHQKMMKHHHNIPSIVSHIRSLAEQQQNLNNQLQSPSSYEQIPTPLVQTVVLESLQANTEISVTVFDWDSWMMHNEKVWEERLITEWLNGVEDIYGNF